MAILRSKPGESPVPNRSESRRKYRLRASENHSRRGDEVLIAFERSVLEDNWSLVTFGCDDGLYAPDPLAIFPNRFERGEVARIEYVFGGSDQLPSF